MIKPEEVTIIIPHLGGTIESEYALDQCLVSLHETVPTIAKTVVINGSTHYEFKYPVPEEINLMFIKKQGQCGAVNSAISTTNTEWIFVTNNDMVYAPNWFERLVGYAPMPTLYSCISPNLVESQKGAPPFLVKNLGGAGGDFRKDLWLEFAARHTHTLVEQGFNLPFLIKKKLWDLIGGYDVNYDPWGSNGDSDLQAKIYLAGAETIRNRNCLVYHFSQTSGTFHPDNREYWQANWEYFKDKWGFYRQEDDQKVWYSKDLIDYEKLIYKPYWMDFYKKQITQSIYS